MYIYTYIYIHTYIYVYIYIYIHINKDMHIYCYQQHLTTSSIFYLCFFLYDFCVVGTEGLNGSDHENRKLSVKLLDLHIYTYKCIYIYVYLYASIYTYIYIYIHIFIYVYYAFIGTEGIDSSDHDNRKFSIMLLNDEDGLPPLEGEGIVYVYVFLYIFICIYVYV
jgi:hypothetical protein